MYEETKATPDVVIELKPGESTEIPGHAKTTVENQTHQEGKLFFRLNPPPVTNGTILVPPHDGRDVPLGATGGLVRNEGEVPLTIVYFIG